MLLYDAALQIAERKKLVSSIKNTLIDPQGIEQPYKVNKATISSLEAAANTEGNNIQLQFLSTSDVRSP